MKKVNTDILEKMAKDKNIDKEKIYLKKLLQKN